MASTLFIALQCYECSTMQVKQKKKSSNKWVCVICNQKQSVKKVFAQGYKAKELRFFVQSFNMSRKVADEEAQAVADSCSEVDVEGEVDEEVLDVSGTKKRSDWSEYLDFDSPNDRRGLAGEEDDVKIVTEMPNNMFKRPKLNKDSNAGGSSSVTGSGKKDSNEIFKPSFSRRSIKKPDLCSDGVVTRKKDIEERNLEAQRVTKPASKWDAYLIDEEGEHQGQPRIGGNKALKDEAHVGEWDRAIMERNAVYQIVDDEVHPDFM
ncbi:MRN complex-interacting protein [Arabidopsis thaliana x Arabidopsis arenosa]|uniref:MRN complex-interacting protein n=1 Tax=Arabidopsis thaliana x Arabidopsis arenosa TaxID=1240361 RepID=A0A8T2BK67_9BRAS|nr:MRN complex-interacting protein [Arabidopsis thaliana x Arabidopsis arenosa]